VARAPAFELRGGALAWCATFAVLALARALLGLVPGRWAWGLDAAHDVPLGFAIAITLLSLLACVPAIAATIARRIDHAGRAGGAALALTPLAAAALAWTVADRGLFLGDHILRQGAIDRGATFASLFPESLPLDVALHGALPALLERALGVPPETFARLLGALEAALLAGCARGFVRALRLDGVAALASGAALVLGGWLTMFTGFGKSASELTLVTIVLASGAVRCARGEDALLPCGLATAFALTLHRSAVFLLPTFALAAIAWWRANGRLGAWRRVSSLVALAAPALALAWTGPRIVTIVRTFDLAHHVGGTPGGALRATFAPLHLLDLANLMLALAPLLALLPALLVLRASSEVRREGAPLAALALAFAPALLVAQPQQGLFRDWDVFTPAVLALALLASWRWARLLEATPARRWLHVPALGAAALPALLWLALYHDPEATLRRARAIAAGPPVREAAMRAQTWDYVGIVELRRRRWPQASDAFRASAAAEPQVRVERQWALAATLAGRYEEAERAYLELLERSPAQPTAWLGLAGVARRLGHASIAARALAHVQADASDAKARAEMAAFVRQYPEVWPDEPATPGPR
jgi:tetratricopeptide (TPR) repeat protein